MRDNGGDDGADDPRVGRLRQQRPAEVRALHQRTRAASGELPDSAPDSRLERDRRG